MPGAYMGLVADEVARRAYLVASREWIDILLAKYGCLVVD